MAITSLPRLPKKHMSNVEFVRLAKSIFGPNWKKPTARVVNRSAKMIRCYAAGTNNIPDDIADHLRALNDIGHAGRMIKAAMLRALLESKIPGQIRRGPHERAHILAMQLVDDLERAGLIRKERG